MSDARRITARDNKLWLRDKNRASLYGFHKLPCPCTQHKGTGLSFRIEEVEKHLLRYGRAPNCRTWRGPEDPDSSDEEWKADFSTKIAASTRRRDKQDNGIEVRQMLQHMYQEVQHVAERENEINDITLSALETVDNITGINGVESPMEDMQSSLHNENVQARGTRDEATDSGEQPHGCGGGEPHQTQAANDINCQSVLPDDRPEQRGDYKPYADSNQVEDERVKDAKALEDAMRLLYDGSRHSKLGATVMTVNLVATHSGITEKATDDLLATIQCLLTSR